MQWKIGKVRITKVVELETIGSTRFILPLPLPGHHGGGGLCA